ncbi:CHAP domain-containing protein [Acidisoma silvae]|uniref:CHAP domain-containing protein n=1 Tax=Acidisoma silvae TaxID=2802396 RepID=A0A963YQ08_9PROT|nr:CHAP domain-containing protein [Acidisoma silvae]MCB8874671.1 CHAP domain-containing protein [Acidisoma silvae]
MMRVTGRLRLNLVAASALFVGLFGISLHAEAATKHEAHKSSSRATHHQPSHTQHASRSHAHSTHHVAWAPGHHASFRHKSWVHHVAWHSRQTSAWLECVPYARRVSGIELRGNANTWWREADGRYERGQTPQAGAVLSFQSSRHMELGHVAVVTQTVNPREVLISQANWPMPGQRNGNVSKAISVIDVSPDNDWTAVRVERGHSGDYGSVYATNGFIYGHSTADTLMADELPAKSSPAAAPAGISAGWSQTVQLASAPSYGNGPAIADSAPDRNLR